MKILLIDDHILFRAGLASLLKTESDIDIVGEADDLQQATSMVSNLKPDLILMEFGDNVSDDLRTIRNLITHHPNLLITLLSNHNPDDVLAAVLRSGVKGFITKDSSIDKVVASIRGLARGEMALSRRMTRRAIDMLCSDERDNNGHVESLKRLTTREMEVLKILASGVSNQAIADRLSISENTVKIHVHKVLKKLKLRNRREAARFANQSPIALALSDIGQDQGTNGNYGWGDR